MASVKPGMQKNTCFGRINFQTLYLVTHQKADNINRSGLFQNA